jgi:hypothetical protein
MDEIQMSPVPKKNNAVTYSFTDALKELISGRRITRLEWATNDEYGILKDGWLMIYRNGAEGLKFYRWTVSQADMEAIDWVLLPEAN